MKKWDLRKKEKVDKAELEYDINAPIRTRSASEIVREARKDEILYKYADNDFPDDVNSGGREAVLKVRHLNLGFLSHGKKTHVIRDVSLDVFKGETLAIVGESGSGKSVFTKTFTGMLDSNGIIDGGTIEFDGVDLAKLKTEKEWLGIRGKRIATIFQDPMTSLNPLLSIGYQITEVLRLHRGMDKQTAKAEAIELLKKVQIPEAENRFNDYPYQYSGGMRQRVVIAIALACNPEILICDEPTTALDVTVQAQIIKLIKDLQREYKWTVIFITHDLGVVANIADRVAVMYGGQIVEYGTAEDVFYNPSHPYTWALLSSLPQLGSKEDPLVYIQGNPPSFLHEIIGDSFAPRNIYAMKVDFLLDPPMFRISDTHFAKTWLLDPRAPKVEPPRQIQNLRQRMKESAEELQREVKVGEAA
ncbi:MAG: ABC transporter ATP-binding protein [Bacilli bacterium]|jgi:oligopeptide transport system ATP-binding protein